MPAALTMPQSTELASSCRACPRGKRELVQLAQAFPRRHDVVVENPLVHWLGPGTQPTTRDDSAVLQRTDLSEHRDEFGSCGTRFGLRLLHTVNQWAEKLQCVVFLSKEGE